MVSDEGFDVVVVGAGPTGLACGIECGRRGLKTAVFDKGCVVNSIYNYPTHMTFFTTPELLEIGGIPMTSMYEKPTRTEALKYYRRVAAFYGLNLHQYETVEHISGGDGSFALHTLDRAGFAHAYPAKKVILATGYYDRPNPLDIPGEDLPKVTHYYKEPHPCFGQDVLVIGGKNSAAIAALELHWAGARVTLVHRGPGLSPSVKYWIKPNLENRIAAGEIGAYFLSRVVEILPEAVTVETPGGEVRLRNDFVFAMTGYRPDFRFLEEHGIELDPESKRPRIDAETFESTRRGIYLAGVVVAGMNTNEVFIENGRLHGVKIADAIAALLSPPGSGGQSIR